MFVNSCLLVCAKEGLHVTVILWLLIACAVWKLLGTVTHILFCFLYLQKQLWWWRGCSGQQDAAFGPGYPQVSGTPRPLAAPRLHIPCGAGRSCGHWSQTSPRPWPPLARVKLCKENKVCCKCEFNVFSDLTASFKWKHLSWAKGTFASPNKWNYG